MSNCWAASLGGCDDKMSREHYVSKSLFITPQVSVKGLAWCKDEAKIIGIESATAKILCRKHNSDLSELDNAAAQAFDSLRQQTKLSNERAQFPTGTRFKIVRFPINAKLLERWLLKTLINLTFEGIYKIGKSQELPGIPPKELVDICFGKVNFEDKAGMYVAINEGMIINMGDTVNFSPLIKNSTEIHGGFFEFRGIRFFISLLNEGLEYPLSSIPNLDSQWQAATLSPKFAKIKAKHGKNLSHVVDFKWGK